MCAESGVKAASELAMRVRSASIARANASELMGSVP